ncbi:hypothetical protein MUK42_33156 [Musa troglodytarum]|uniref:Uncharacterized protein n=1 Tax=Musa troglodytarum TaxID=320322 RepID=A0A9E7LAL0_9LILI|nr:hypothetical protein MUK42_33156 [Musa troglodytarum]
MNPNTVATNSDRHHLPPSRRVPSGVPEGALGATPAIRRLPVPSPMIRRQARKEQQREPRVGEQRFGIFVRCRGGLVATCVKKLRMHIETNLKRYRTLEGAGEIIMSVCQAEYFRQLLKPVT